MSTPTPDQQPPTLRLLEPRALAAADRLIGRMTERAAPLVRALTHGAIGFSERLYHYWIGRTLDRPPSARATRGPAPSALSFPHPWYDEPSVWPKRGITLRAPTQPTAVRATMPGVAAPPPPEPRAIDFVATYVESPPDATVDASTPATSRAPTIAATSAPASTPMATIPARAAAPIVTPRPSIVERALARLDLVDAILQPSLATPSVPSAVAPRTSAPTFTASLARSTAPIVYVELPATPERVAQVAPRREVGVAPSFVAPSLAGGPATVSTPIALTAALPSAVAWPRVQQFLQTIAGPMVLRQAGVLAPEAELPSSRAVPVFTREMVAPWSSIADAPLATASRVPSRVSAAPLVAAAAFAATAFGEVRRVVGDAPASFAPGRVAQNAELVARFAESRVARQLGAPPVETPRSTLWSADAFTMVTPEPAFQTISRASSPGPQPTRARAAVDGSSAVRAPAAASFAPTASVAPAPRSVAGVLAFVDDRVGARSSLAARALPVGAPEIVYVAPRLDVATPSAPARAVLPPPALTLPATFETAPVAEPPLARAALRSEQIAGEVGLRIGALASEFLIDPHGNVDASVGYTPLMPQSSQRAWLSTDEWVLLSVFPSQSTANEVASSAARRAATVGERGAMTVVAPSASPVVQATTGPRGALPLPALDAALRPGLASPARIVEAAPTQTTSLAAGAPPVIGAAASLVAPAPASSIVSAAHAPAMPTLVVAGRAMTTQRLPDGRPARGARLVPHTATPLVAPSAFLDGNAPTPLLAGSAAAERRVESPVGAPLWGHLPALVNIAAPEGETRADGPAPSRPRLETVAPRAQPKVDSARSVALELIAPFVEAARAEPSTSAASFSRPATPVVSGSAPDDATRSLVSALVTAQSSGAAPQGGDRLTLADLTLISLVSAVDQVAAASPRSSVGSGDNHAAATTGTSGAGAHFLDEGDEIERLVERVFDAFKRRMSQLVGDHGGHWER